MKQSVPVNGNFVRTLTDILASVIRFEVLSKGVR